MSKKIETKVKNKSKKTPEAGTLPNPIDRISPRQELLARVAGSVAAGIVGDPSPATESALTIAAVAVDIAAHILEKAGIPSPISPEKSGEV